jgi:hypothetical protein
VPRLLLLPTTITITALLLSPCASVAQVTQTGVISGQVVDVESEPIIAASVTVFNSTLIGSRVSTVTDADGRFRIPGLPPGTYKIEVRHESYVVQVLYDVHLKVDEVLRLLIVLTAAGEEPVEVPLRPVPLIEIISHSLSEILNDEALYTLPLDRRFTAAFRVSPGSFELAQGPAVSGSTPRDNAFFADGIDLSDPHDGTVALDIVFDSISKIEVTSALLDSTLAPTAGGTAEITTLAPTDHFSADASFFFNSGALNGNNVQETRKPDYHLRLPSIVAGGPAFGGKAWLFAGFSYIDSAATLPATRLSPEQAEGHLFNSKAVYKLNDRTDVSFTYLSDGVDRKHYLSPNTALWSVLEADADRADWDYLQETDLLSLGIAYRLSEEVKLHLDGSLTARSIDVLPSSGEIDYKSSINPLDFIVYRGSPWTEWRDESRERWRLSGGFDYYLDELAGTHDISLGLELERTKTSSKFDIVSGDRIISIDMPGWESERPLYIELYRTTDGQPGPIFTQSSLTRFSIFARDNWSPFPSLALLFGVRYDGPIIDNSETKVLDWDVISPRLGVSWDPFGHGKTAIRFSYARYHDAASTARAVGDPYYLARGYRWRTLQDLGYPVEPNDNTYNSPFNTETRFGYGVPGYNADVQTVAPATDEYYISAEHEINTRMSTRLDIVYRRSRNLLEDIETNLWQNYSSATATDSLGETYAYFIRNLGIDGSYNPRLYWTNTDELMRNYTGATISLRARPSRFLYGLVQYTWSKTKGNIDVTYDAGSSFSPILNDPNTMINSYGYLSTDHRHDLRVLLHGSLAYGIGVGALVSYLSGAPYNRLLTIPVEENPFSYGLTIFADPRGTVFRLDDQFNIDLRVEKMFPSETGGLTVLADIFNLLNSSAVIERFEIDGSRFGEPLAWVAPRTIRLGIRYSF